MTVWLRQTHRLIGSLIFFGFFGLYSLTSFRVPINYADSNDLTLASYFGGFAHPPGYPLLLGLLHPWLKLVEVTKAVGAANVTSSFFTSLCITLLYFVFIELWRFSKKPVNKNDFQTVTAAGLAAALFIGLFYTVWFQARVLEVFPLAQTLMALCLWLLLKIINGKRGGKWYTILAFAATVSIVYHPLTGLLLGPTLIFFLKFIKRDRQSWLWAMGGVFLAFLVNAALYKYFMTKTSLYAWPLIHSIKGVWDFVLRRVYLEEGSAVEIYTKTLDFGHSLKSVLIWLKLWWSETYGLGLIIIFLGMVFLYQKMRFIFWWLLVCILISGIGLTMYHRYPLEDRVSELEYYWGTQLRWRMQFVCFLPMTIALFYGYLALMLKIKKRKFGPRQVGYGLVIILIASVAVLAWFRQFADQWGDRLTQQHIQEVMNFMPYQATLVVDSDLIFAFLFEQLIYQIRTDLTIIPMRFSLAQTVQSDINLPFGEITSEDAALERIVGLLQQEKEIFIYAPSGTLLSFLGVEGNPYYAAPFGYTLQIGKKMPQITTNQDFRSTSWLSWQRNKQTSWWIKGLRANFMQIHAQMAYYWQRLGYDEAAEKHRAMMKLLVSMPQTMIRAEESDSLAKWAYNNQGPYSHYQEPKAEYFINKITQDMKAQEIQYLISRAILIEPYNNSYWPLIKNLKD